MAEQSWGLTRRQWREVLGIRAAGLLFVGLGIPVVETLATYAWGLGTGRAGSNAWQLGTLVDRLRDKTVLLGLLSSSGLCLLSIAIGIWLIRCDPRPLLRERRT